MDMAGCDVSNNLEPKDPVQASLVQYHLAPSPRFENVEDFGIVVSSD